MVDAVGFELGERAPQAQCCSHGLAVRRWSSSGVEGSAVSPDVPVPSGLDFGSIGGGPAAVTSGGIRFSFSEVTHVRGLMALSTAIRRPEINRATFDNLLCAWTLDGSLIFSPPSVQDLQNCLSTFQASLTLALRLW